MQGPRKYSSFKTTKDFTSYFQCRIKDEQLTPHATVAPVEPSAWVQESIKRAFHVPLNSEKIVSEGLIFPILLEALAAHFDRVTLFSGVEWGTVETAPVQLSGFCDFIIGGLPGMSAPEAPMICVVEAKKEDFESGSRQCGAELFACKINNEAAGIRYPFYFGCVTIGAVWKFICLNCETNNLIRDMYAYTIGNLPQLLGVWNWVIETQLASALEKKSE